jgi:hypothetical protein
MGKFKTTVNGGYYNCLNGNPSGFNTFDTVQNGAWFMANIGDLILNSTNSIKHTFGQCWLCWIIGIVAYLKYLNFTFILQ